MKRLAATAAILLIATAASAQEMSRRFKLPPHPPAAVYGDVLIRRLTADGPAKPVVFSHWRHRTRYTCRVCHLELDFQFKRNATPITEEANRKGQYCGACHNGVIAFGQTEANCARCHTGAIAERPDDFKMLSDLPWSPYGNGVDWSRALAGGAIKPAGSLSKDFETIPMDKMLTLEAEWNFVAPAVFPHTEHVRWLDCANCHPSIFNIKKKTTKHFSMTYNLAGDFCGVCHLRVAFPMDDCIRCHPTMKSQPQF